MYSSQFVFPYTASDTATLQRNMSSKRHMWCYACRTPPPGKPRRVLCCLSRKQLVLKDYILGFIPRRSTAYRLCPSTKVPTPRPSGRPAGACRHMSIRVVGRRVDQKVCGWHHCRRSTDPSLCSFSV